MVAATLGVLKCGKAYVALDPAHPVARLAHIADYARCARSLAMRPTLLWRKS